VEAHPNYYVTAQHADQPASSLSPNRIRHPRYPLPDDNNGRWKNLREVLAAQGSQPSNAAPITSSTT
jgi:hypothetical protein